MKKIRSSKILPKLLFALTILGLVFGLVLIARPDLAHAMRSVYQMASLFARVEKEIMLPTPHGRYYRDLYWNHFNELSRIFTDYPELQGNMFMLMNLYTPHIEAVLDGRGEEISITKDQVEEMESFFLNIAAVANEELRLDIERELNRTPLEDFIDLSMDETLFYIEAAYQRDFPE